MVIKRLPVSWVLCVSRPQIKLNDHLRRFEICGGSVQGSVILGQATEASQSALNAMESLTSMGVQMDAIRARIAASTSLMGTCEGVHHAIPPSSTIVLDSTPTESSLGNDSTLQSKKAVLDHGSVELDEEGLAACVLLDISTPCVHGRTSGETQSGKETRTVEGIEGIDEGVSSGGTDGRFGNVISSTASTGRQIEEGRVVEVDSV